VQPAWISVQILRFSIYFHCHSQKRHLSEYDRDTKLSETIPNDHKPSIIHIAIVLCCRSSVSRDDILERRRDHSFIARSLSALAITDTELKLMAAAAIIGFSSNPNAGNSTPAASGTPTAL